MSADPDPRLRRRSLLASLLAPPLGLGTARAGAVAAPLRLLCGELPPLTESPSLHARVRAMAMAAGHTAPTEFMPWQRALQEASEGGRALIYPFARTPERERHWHWLALLAHEEGVLLVRRDALLPGDASPSSATLQALRVGALRNSAFQTGLERDGYAHIEPAPSERANAMKLSMNRIQAWSALASVVDYWMKRELIGSEGLIRLRRGALPIYLAASLDIDSASLTAWVNASSLRAAR